MGFMSFLEEIDDDVLDAIVQVFYRILLRVGHLTFIRRDSMVHVDEAYGDAKTLRDLIVICHNVFEFIFGKEFLDDTQVHLALLHFDFKTARRVDALRLFFIDMWLVVLKLLALI